MEIFKTIIMEMGLIIWGAILLIYAEWDRRKRKKEEKEEEYYLFKIEYSWNFGLYLIGVLSILSGIYFICSELLKLLK